MKKVILFVCLSIFIFNSCSNNKQNDLKKINDLKKALYDKTATNFDTKKAEELINLYVKFANDYPKDTSSVSFLFEAANLSTNIKPKYAIELFDKIINEYSDDKRVPDCVFFKAFTYDEKLKDIKKARESYETYLKKYPNYTWAKDIPRLIEMLGKTPEQIGAELVAKQQNDSLSNKK